MTQHNSCDSSLYFNILHSQFNDGHMNVESVRDKILVSDEFWFPLVVRLVLTILRVSGLGCIQVNSMFEEQKRQTRIKELGYNLVADLGDI